MPPSKRQRTNTLSFLESQVESDSSSPDSPHYDTSDESDYNSHMQREMERQTTESGATLHNFQYFDDLNILTRSATPTTTTTNSSQLDAVHSGYYLHADPKSTQSGDTQSCLSFRMERIRKEFGSYPTHKEDCFACTNGRYRDVALRLFKFIAIVRMFQQQRVLCDEIKLCKQIYIFFEKHIRAPANRAARILGKDLMPEWTLISIWSHFYEHITEPSVLIRNWIESNNELIQNFDHVLLWKRKRNPDGHIIQVPRSKYFTMRHQTITLTARLLSMRNLDKMVGANPGLTLEKSSVQPINTRDRPMFVRTIKSNLK
jgi:hypothetical protein